MEPMDRLSPYDPCERVVLKFSSQTGKTEAILNFIGYIIDLDPGPILAIQPNVTPMGEAFSKDRINPMIRDSPTLREKVSGARARDANSTITHKSFPGGHLTIAGANSPAGLASRPIRYLLCDEIDRWEVTKEGDPLLLARKRQQTYRTRRRAKELIVSSPTYDDLGVSAEYAACTQRYEWHLACQHCGKTQRPQLKHYKWDVGPASMIYACEHCGGVHGLELEHVLKASGLWVCVQDGPAKSAGYWMSQWSSPFARWTETLEEWVSAAGDQSKMQAVTNTVFAEGWSGDGDKVEAHTLRSREEDYAADVPAGVGIITIGADVQSDRIEIEVVGWGSGRESWSLGYHVIPGEPTSEEVWEELLELYRAPYQHETGMPIKASAMCVDSGAYTQHVYEFVRRSGERGIVPVKGAAGMSRDQIDNDRRAINKRVARRMRHGKPPEILGVDSLKRTIYSYLMANPGRAGYCHFPRGRSDEYYDQLTGERLVTVQVRGKRPERRWQPIHPAVEALDCRVYAYAALLLLGSDEIKAISSGLAPKRAKQKPKQAQDQAYRDPRPPRGGPVERMIR